MESTLETRIRCVYAYYRTSKTKDGLVTYPYYVGKGTIRRAYDWVRHTGFGLPPKAEDVRILGKNMSDVDARQAEMLLIYLFGRKLDNRFASEIRPSWASSSYRSDVTGTLLNKTIGGDGAASSDPTAAAVAGHNEREFWAHNPCFSLVTHPDGYWYSPQYPAIKSTHGQWLRKRTAEHRTVRKKKPKRKHAVRFDLATRVDSTWPNAILTFAEKEHYKKFGSIFCEFKYDNDCRCHG